MKKLTLLAAVCAMLAVPVAQAASPSGPGKPTVTLNFLEVQTSFGGTISANEPPKPGDRIWLHSEFYKWKGSKRGAHFGHADATGVFSGSRTLLITGVASLPGGTLSVAGLASQQRVTTFAVVGGTGIYATARGEVILRSLGGSNSNLSADTIRLWK